MSSSQFDNEQEIEEELEQQPSSSPKSVNSLSLGDAQELVAALSAIALKFGNNEKGVIATLNTLLKRSEVLDKEQQDIIAPLLGELKALLLTSQDELKNFNQQAQKSLESQIKEVIGRVDFSPIQKKVEAANTQILESTNALKIKVEEIETIANRTKRLGFFASLKFVVLGFGAAAGFLFALYQYNTSQFEAKLKSEYDAKWSSLDSKFQVLNTQKPNEWNILKMKDDAGREYLQFIVRDNNKQVQCGYADSKKSSMGFNVSYFNIPIFK